MFQDLSRAQLKPIFDGFETRLKFIKFWLRSVKWPWEATETQDFQIVVKIDRKIKKFVKKLNFLSIYHEKKQF